jgi:hypothetical protein
VLVLTAHLLVLNLAITIENAASRLPSSRIQENSFEPKFKRGGVERSRSLKTPSTHIKPMYVGPIELLLVVGPLKKLCGNGDLISECWRSW